MHNWFSNEEVDWKGISDAAYYIGTKLRKWGRVNVSDMKEKYGTVRVYCSLGWSCLLNITHPGYQHYGPYSKWLMRLDIYVVPSILKPLNWLIIPYHKMLYTYVYGRALRKWPHLREEILDGADYSNLLTRYGVHVIRISKNSYKIDTDWHEDNFSVRHPQEPYVEPESNKPIKWVKRDWNI